MTHPGPSLQPLSFPRHLSSLTDYLQSLPNDHPVHVALRTYALSLTLSLGPALIPFIASPSRVGGRTFRDVLRREFGASGFAFAMTVGVGGGAVLNYLRKTASQEDILPVHSKGNPSPWRELLARVSRWFASLKDTHKTFLCNIISASLAIALMHSRRRPPRRLPSPLSSKSSTFAGNLTNGRPSATLDLTLLLLVRALDSIFRSTFLPSTGGHESQSAEDMDANQRRRRALTTRMDAFVFWASSARIMWCFFYEPERLPRSYNKWIMSLANIDPCILGALRALRSGAFSYSKHVSNPPDLVTSLSQHLGYPASWGDPALLPAVGGPTADAAWKVLGVNGRSGIGGIPCELVHGGVTGGSCTANSGIRGFQAFLEAVAIYLPVHILPTLVRNPQKLLSAPHLVSTALSITRSATFLSTFVSSIWFAVCFTRTLVLARLFPWIPHDFWDGPFGCTFVGSLVCGSSIWIEEGRRRGEMALYVLPRAIRACLPEQWIRSRRKTVKLVERLTFVLSLATLLTAYTHRGDSLRGLSRWTLKFVMNGPNFATWRKRSTGSTTSPFILVSPPPESETEIVKQDVEPSV